MDTNQIDAALVSLPSSSANASWQDTRNTDSDIRIGESARVGQVAAGSNNTQTSIGTFITNFLGNQDAARDRRAMLELVSNIWGHDVLEESLYNDVFIQLGLQEDSGAVEHPWDVQFQVPDQSDSVLPRGTTLLQVFDGLNGALLLLGEPGAGKTTMLLQLTSDLIARANQDPLRRIPVVLNLSSWSNPNQSIAEWLVSELGFKYQVSNKVALGWVERDDLVLLLDGLDEVRAARRNACVKALNTFRREHGMMPVVVCCRRAEYHSLAARLQLQGAVLIQPLTREQIDDFLWRAGPELAAVIGALERDATLLDLARQPLMLNIIALAYRDMPVLALVSSGAEDIQARRQHLLDAYIHHMFNRVARTKNETYSPTETQHWLTWLAQQMTADEKTTFSVKGLQHNWLRTHVQRKRLGLILMMVGGVVVALSSRVEDGLFGGLAFGLAVGVFIGLLSGLLKKQTNDLTNPQTQLHNRVWHQELAKLKVQPVWLAMGIVGLLYVLNGGLVGALVGGLVTLLSYETFGILYYCSLRLILYRNHAMPLRYEKFLDYAAERILLRKVGDGYTFPHRVLMEHFARMEECRIGF